MGKGPNSPSTRGAGGERQQRAGRCLVLGTQRARPHGDTLLKGPAPPCPKNRSGWESHLGHILVLVVQVKEQWQQAAPHHLLHLLPFGIHHNPHCVLEEPDGELPHSARLLVQERKRTSVSSLWQARGPKQLQAALLQKGASCGVEKVCPGRLGSLGLGVGEGDPAEGWRMLPGQGVHRWGSARLPTSCNHHLCRDREAEPGWVHVGGLGRSTELPRAAMGSGGCGAKHPPAEHGRHEWRCLLRGARVSPPALRR